MRRGLRLVLLVVLLVPALTIMAGETGSISGKVSDASGGALPGVMVKVFGPQLPAGRTMTTSASGAYNFQRLLPGRYTVSAELQGLGKSVRTVTVQVDNDYQIELALKGGTETAVEVVASSVDTKSAEVNFNYGAETIKDLPLPRSYAGMLQLIPGAAAPDGIGMAIAGGSRQDNKYMVDGVSITNPGYGNLGIDTNQLDVADFNIKTGGITAEFGRTQGAIVNAVTKSGTNDFHGAVFVEAMPSSFRAAYKNTINQDVDVYDGAASVGFPIFKDVLFGYVSGRYYGEKDSAQSSIYGSHPDTKITNQDYFGKLTGNIGQSLLMNASFRVLPQKTQEGFNSIYDSPTAAWGSDVTNLVGNVSASWFISSNSFVEAKYVHTKESDLTQAQTILSSRPPQVDPANLGAFGAYVDPARLGGNVGVYQYASTGDDYLRDEIKLSASQFLDWGQTQHQIKVGGGYENDDYNFVRQSNGWGNFTTLASNLRTDFYNTQPKQLGRGRTYSIFLQDTMTWNRLSVTVGVLFNKDDFAQICPAGSVVCGGTTAIPLASETRYNFATFGWDKEVQPRFGVVYNTELVKGDKVYFNYGKYSGLDQKSAARSWAPYRIRQDYEYFDLSGKWLYETVRGASTGKVIPQDLKAPYQDEIMFGYAAPVTKTLSVEAYYQYRALHDALEDAPIDPTNYNGSFMIENLPWARRYYRGVTLDINKRFSDNWSADINYTYSKLEGNFDLDYASITIFNSSSILEDGPGANTFEPNRNGTLTQDHPHLLKIFANYSFPFGLSLGGYYSYQSGTAWQAQGYDATGGQNRYLEPGGSRHLCGWSNLDLSAAYSFKLGCDVGLRIEGRVGNVFNTQAVLSVNKLQYLDAYVNGTPASTMGPQGTTKPNPSFGQATSWSAPRRFVLSALLDF